MKLPYPPPFTYKFAVIKKLMPYVSIDANKVPDEICQTITFRLTGQRQEIFLYEED